MDRHHAGRRRGCAHQYPPHRDGAGLLHQCGEPKAHHRRRRTVRVVHRRAAAHHRRCQDLASWRRKCQFPAHGSRSRQPRRGRARRRRPSRAHHRRSRALHLHVWHDRPAEGRQHEPLSGDARKLRVCRGHGYARERPHVRLPAALSHRRRRGRNRCASGQRRISGDPR